MTLTFQSPSHHITTVASEPITAPSVAPTDNHGNFGERVPWSKHSRRCYHSSVKILPQQEIKQILYIELGIRENILGGKELRGKRPPSTKSWLWQKEQIPIIWVVLKITIHLFHPLWVWPSMVNNTINSEYGPSKCKERLIHKGDKCDPMSLDLCCSYLIVAGQDGGRKLSCIDGINSTIYYKENSHGHIN